MSTAVKAVSNIDIANKNKINELKTIQKFLNSMFPIPVNSATSQKTSTVKKTTKTNQV